MGSAYSSGTNLGSDCTSFNAGETGTKACWGDSFKVSMGNWKEVDTDVWGVKYEIGQKRCGFQLKASHDKDGVESIHFGLGDSADNKTDFALTIIKDGRDGLRGGITGIKSSGSPMSYTRDKQNYSIETTILSYGCSQRDGLFVLEMKKKVNSDNAYMVTLAHYYLTKDVGLSVVAKIRRNKGNGFVVEVEGPLKHPSTDLRKVLVKTCRTGVWTPAACSHCHAAKASSGSKSGVSHSPLKPQSTHQNNDTVGQVVNHPSFSNYVREQSNTGIINSNGYTRGSLNNSIIFIHCNF